MTTAATKPITFYHYLWLIGGIAMTVLPHATHMPLWIILLSLGLMAYRLLRASGHLPVARANNTLTVLIRLTLIILAFIGIRLQFGTLVGRDAGSALLVLLTGLKILEATTERDFYIANFLGFFVIITGFFYLQSIATAIYTALTLLIMITGIMVFNDRDRYLPLARTIKQAGLLLLQAVPFAVVLFLLFPRIDGPLWGLPDDAYAGLTGIDDVMEPGSISRLIFSDTVVFRVVFAGENPRQGDLYWRGPVLWYTDGARWTRDDNNYQPAGRIIANSEPLQYTITQEPTNKRWLFALEMPLESPPEGLINSEYQLLAKKSVRQRLRYELSSSLDYRHENSNRRALQRALQLPEDQHPETRALATGWRATVETADELVAKTLNWFNTEEFFYTLSPPLAGEDRIDGFLFNTRQGFCEHYAAAFVVLMRAAGIPARVVTGYQGGKYNPVGDYFVVRQQDAHAWAEVWLGEKGWIRVDPTAAVAPERVEQGIQGALPDTVIDIPLAFNQNQLSRDLWQRLSNTWDAINNQWNQWVISYGPQRQTQFLSQFGLQTISLHKLSILMIVCVALLLLFGMLVLLRKRLIPVDPARNYYDQFCRKLAAIGIARRASEGPLDYAARVKTERSDLINTVDAITESYVACRYGPDTSRLMELAASVRRFRPGRSASSS